MQSGDSSTTGSNPPADVTPGSQSDSSLIAQVPRTAPRMKFTNFGYQIASGMVSHMVFGAFNHIHRGYWF